MSSPSTAVSPSAPCRLCGEVDRLILGHVIPQFVYRASADRRAPGTSRRAQDGPTRPMLCRRCEQTISGYESEFARHIFHPLRANSGLRVNYRSWLLKFAVSVCWRVLDYAAGVTETMPGFVSDELAVVGARETWRGYLRGRRADVGSHHLHLLGKIDFCAEPSVTMESFKVTSGTYVVARLGKITLVGVIAEHPANVWTGTRIDRVGRIKPREIVIPPDLLTHLGSRATITV